MRWWTEREAREERTHRTALLLRLLCTWDPGWLCSAGPLTTILPKEGKLAQGKGRGQRKIAGVSRDIGYDANPVSVPAVKIFCSGLEANFYLEKWSCSDVSSPGFGLMVSTASWVSKTVV